MGGKQRKNQIRCLHAGEVVASLNALLQALDMQFPANRSRFPLGDTCAHYTADIAQMEGLSRALWGLFPLMASGESTPFSEKYLTAIKLGTDPQSSGYWGETGPFDQRLVEMAAYGLGLALMGETLTARFTGREVMNLHAWLNQITDAQMPDSNWNYFAIMVQLGFKRAGLPYDQAAIDHRFALMDAYYLGDGWYSDGPGRPKDYYISMAFHFYGLIYATLSNDEARAKVLRERSRLFAEDFIYWSAADGASVPFGRSLTYRFAMVAFWSAVAFFPAGRLHPGHRERHCAAASALVAAAVDCRSRRHSHPGVCVSEPGDVRGLQLPRFTVLGAENLSDPRRCRKHTRSGRRKNNRCPRLLKNM